MIQMQTFLRNSDQQVSRYGNPDLRLHRVLAGAKEDLDAQVLLDPFEEQLHLPALAVKISDQFGLQGKVVGQKHQPFPAVVFDHDPTQRRGVCLARKTGRQHTRLIAQHRSAQPVHRVRVTALEFGVALGTRHKEGLRLVNHKQSGEIQIAPIHQIERTRLQHQIVHHIDLVRLAVGDVNETGDVASQVQQRVQLDGGLGRAKRRPCKHRQAQVDGAGVERINRRVEFQTKRLRGVQGSRQANQVLGKVRIDLPRARCVRIGQRVARNRLTTKAHVIQPSGLGAQVDFDIAQGLAVGQLREGHGEELIQAREIFDLVFAPVVGHTATKRAQGQIEHKLRKYELALVHGGFGRNSAKNPKSDVRRSNRDQTETPNSTSKSLTYDVRMVQRWDTTDLNSIKLKEIAV